MSTLSLHIESTNSIAIIPTHLFVSTLSLHIESTNSIAIIMITKPTHLFVLYIENIVSQGFKQLVQGAQGVISLIPRPPRSAFLRKMGGRHGTWFGSFTTVFFNAMVFATR